MTAADAAGMDPVPTARFVRPYTITAGRTKASVHLPVEATLLRVSETISVELAPNALQVLVICDHRSVAEVSALVKQPIGVVRILLSDLIEQGLVQVQATITERSSKDERIELIERTLRGLRTY
ncbi:DUF742 domain-containing protein [Nocardioides sp.]|uniref:DUF742 domain-containing protein n=1 Tax=Nocardioides sp. TaxID=35761 RepID=UPI003D0CBAE9